MNTMKKIARFAAMVAFVGATVLFLMLLFVKSEEVSVLLVETLAYVVFELILSKVGIGIIAFMLGGIIVMAWGGNRQAKAETEITYLKNELAEAKEELQVYKAREAAQLKELNDLNKSRAENGKAIIKAIS